MICAYLCTVPRRNAPLREAGGTYLNICDIEERKKITPVTKLEKLYSIIENSREVGVRLSKDVLQQVEELEENIIKEEILPA